MHPAPGDRMSEKPSKTPMGRTSRVTLEERLDAQQQQILVLEEQIAKLSMHLFRRRTPP
ncbi:MAG: hypothetical protein WC277_11745 [Bacilli bacterium]